MVCSDERRAAGYDSRRALFCLQGMLFSLCFAEATNDNWE